MQSRRLFSFRAQRQRQHQYQPLSLVRYRSSVLTKSELNDKKDQPVVSGNDRLHKTIPEKRGLPIIGNLIELIMSNGAAQ